MNSKPTPSRFDDLLASGILCRILKASKWSVSLNQYEAIALEAEGLASFIRSDWLELSVEEKDLLSCFVYSLIDPKDWLEASIIRVRSIVVFGVARFKGNDSDLKFCEAAIQKFVDSVLSKIESDSPMYSAVLSEVLSEALNDIDNYPNGKKLIPAEDVKEYLNGLLED